MPNPDPVPDLDAAREQPSAAGAAPVKEFWRSLEERPGSPGFAEFMEKEFPNFSSGLIPESTRRQFVRVMGASLALAGLTGCRWPKENILPFSERPENTIPGQPRFFATTMELAGHSRPLVVSSVDGRPIKVEGNDLHPESRGASDGISQASVLDLYDRDRGQKPARRGADGALADSSWAEFNASVVKPLREGTGKKVAFLVESSSSQTRRDVAGRLSTRLPDSSWYEYEAISRDNEREGLRLAYGKALRPTYDCSRAKVIFDVDADLLMSHPGSLAHARGFADARRGFDLDEFEFASPAEHQMSRLYVMETGFSVTGGCADWRVPLPTLFFPTILARIVGDLAENGLELPEQAKVLPSKLRVPPTFGMLTAMLQSLLPDLLEHRGESIVAAGAHMPAAVHALVALLNQQLGNVGPGKPIQYVEEPDGGRPTHEAAISRLCDSMNAGFVDTLVIVGGNPAYTVPDSYQFREGMAQVKTSIHLASQHDETSELCSWYLPRSHYLEAWGDGISYGGVPSIQQPLIAPLYDTRSDIELLSLIADDKPAAGYALVRASLEAAHGGGDIAWRRWLHDGLLREAGSPVSALRRMEDQEVLALDWVGLHSVFEFHGRMVTESTQLFLRLLPDSKVYDGRFANNGWLQELPDPISKLTWDNAVMMNAAVAEYFGLATGDRARIKTPNGAEIVVPVCILPGLPEISATLSLGYGRKHGSVAKDVGIDAYRLRATVSDMMLHDVSITRAGGKVKLATTQSHHSVTDGVSTLQTEDAMGEIGYSQRIQELYREGDLAHFAEHPDFAKRHFDEVTPRSLWNEPLADRDPAQRWAMSIDLNSCTGCSACVVACVAENNVPVVGKAEVIMGREMHWLRIDRYFSGDPVAPETHHQPVPCQQCENAPCEQVCPVAATVHSDDGLNDMVYNRCIGTRYCANNCPYKVRRFNYFNNHLDETDVEKMKWNPNVTVRGRGVMEKCTYCTQRVSMAKIAAGNANAPVADGAVTPACAQACPTGAIVFGDLNDPQSRVSKLHRHERSYAMLAELNVKPRTRYMAKLRNKGHHGG